MAASSPSPTWDQASSPAATRLVRAFEAAWQAAPAGAKPDPRSYLADASPSGTLLALLRAEMALRHDAGEPARARDYLDRYGDLDEDTLVALIYEEFCLAEEAGREADPEAFCGRYPEVAARLRRVLSIHELVGSGRTGSLPLGPAPTVPFPEAGQTIAGFRLVEELGRGAFARVFRAEERQLADRPVALKVARAGSREPQTLAKLQHTHIVPVYSSRTDQATGLHVLCMPYLGCVTLARLLADEQVRHARSGREILEALDRLEPAHRINAGPSAAGRVALARRDYARAIAWWGARLAEALQHAHERGVLHRDVKPSNVLVAGDGLPLLLDFNLAWESCLDDAEIESATLGGTLAYMSPEHIEALAEGDPGGIDHRSDIYALGVVLYEAMGSRPFEAPPRARSIAETFHRAAEQRRAGPTPLRDRHPEVPAELAAVVERCLAADPSARYDSAADLAADLQAVADNRPLKFAAEPLFNRGARWVTRNRDALVVLTPVLALLAILGYVIVLERNDRERLLADTRHLISEGMILADQDNLARAQAQFELARKLASSDPLPPPATEREKELWRVRLSGSLDDLRAIASAQLRQTNEKLSHRADADALAVNAEALRLRLLGFIGPVGDPSAEIRAALEPFYVLQREPWPADELFEQLGDVRLGRLFEDVEDLLFLWALTLDRRLEAAPADQRPDLIATARRCVRQALGFTLSRGPWRALEARLDAAAGRPPAPDAMPVLPDDRASDRACFEWGLLHARAGRLRAAIACLERATRLRQDRYWYQYGLALLYERAGNDPEQGQSGDWRKALIHYHIAIALHEEEPWPRLNRARLYAEMGSWLSALSDLQAAAQRLTPSDGAELAQMLVSFGVRCLAGHVPHGRAELVQQVGRVLAALPGPAPTGRPLPISP